MIGELISLLSLLLSLYTAYPLLASVLTIAAVLVLLYWHYPVLRHPRFLVRLFLVGILCSIALLYYNLGWLSIGRPFPLLLVGGSLVFYGCLSYLAATRPLLWSKAKLNRLNSLVAHGWSWNYDTLFSHKPFYLWDIVEFFYYQRAKAKYLQRRGQNRAAWEAYLVIPEDKLLPAERETLKLEMATHAVIFLGDVIKAKKLLEDVKNKTSPGYLNCCAYIAETEGDWDQSFKLLQEALARCPEGPPATKAGIYNQFGRMRRLEGNYADAIYFYQQATAEAEKDTEKDTLHASYQNLILTKLLAGEKIDQVSPILDAYISRLNLEIVTDWLEFTQLKVDIARQLGDRTALIEHLTEGYRRLMNRPDIDSEAKIKGEVNILRSMASARLLLEEVWENITAHIDTYLLLEMPDRFLCVKEVVYFLDFLRNKRALNDKEQEVASRVTDYMTQRAGRELDDYIAGLPPYAVHERCNLYWERAGVVKRYELPYNFEKVYSLLQDAKDTYRVNGHFIKCASVDLDIADEALAVQRGDVLKTHAVLAEQSLARIKNHPAASEFFLRLAYYWAALQDFRKACHYLKLFRKTGISIDHYALWMQEYYRAMETICTQPGREAKG